MSDVADPRGFLKIKRKKPVERSPEARVHDSREFVIEPPPDEIAAQASRCMDCGIPFCHRGCPLGNVIPEFNDLVWRGRMSEAIRVLHSTNNFPEVTGRVCPAPCEASCVLAIDEAPVAIKDIERAIARAGFVAVPPEADGAGLDDGSPALSPHLPPSRSGRKVAVIGSGPAGLSCAQELARMGHDVLVLERDDRLGGLLRYGIPDFKLEKEVLDRRLDQMRAEGVRFRTSVDVGNDLSGRELLATHDAIVLCVGARAARDLEVPGRELAGVHFAMDFLVQQNRRVAGDQVADAGAILATGKHVVVIGGGDTGSDCVGTSNRQGAASVTQLELMPKPPLVRMPENPWPAWPLVFRTSSSHEEGCDRAFSIVTKAFVADTGLHRAWRGDTGLHRPRVHKLLAVRADVTGGRVCELPGTELELPCDLALLAMGFVAPERGGIAGELGLARDARGNLQSDATGRTNVPRVFAAGDASRGQSLVVWAIADGRRVARSVDFCLKAAAQEARPLFG